MELGHSLAEMQKAVGGSIQILYPFEDPVALVCNEEGKLLRLPANRALRDESGAVYDIVCGTFFLCGAPPDSDTLEGVTEEQIRRYEQRFARPELFLNLGGHIICCLISIIVMNTTGGNFSSFIGSYNIVLIVPITAYVSRKCFNLTKSIWLGPFVNALFVSWCTVSYVGVNDIYVPMQFFSNLLNV